MTGSFRKLATQNTLDPMNLSRDIRCRQTSNVRDLLSPFAFEVQQYDLAIERLQLMDQVKQFRC